MMKFLLGVFAALSLSLALHGQGFVSSSVTGLIRDTGGKAVVGATVTAVHVPTGTSYTGTTNATGWMVISPALRLCNKSTTEGLG